jgi:excisionase family DNA binding protein
MAKEYLTAKEASVYTGISVPKLAKLRRDGKGCPFVRLGDSKTKAIVRYRKSDLDKWLNECLIKTSGGL